MRCSRADSTFSSPAAMEETSSSATRSPERLPGSLRRWCSNSMSKLDLTIRNFCSANRLSAAFCPIALNVACAMKEKMEKQQEGSQQKNIHTWNSTPVTVLYELFPPPPGGTPRGVYARQAATPLLLSQPWGGTSTLNMQHARSTRQSTTRERTSVFPGPDPAQPPARKRAGALIKLGATHVHMYMCVTYTTCV